ncbi:putative ABC transporter permease [Actinacidiphila reveromycinica]|uniref:Putative ABC transporter permease n=1 Tax=Actinacidiphila reveromycinica TaxID=659352 RepID=A0A7U3VLI9_9ACTN|nr:ABC transporter permease [Streptomyces sp. SN-593]BBA95600.1 putative ABC transporter permease [Streptomyces sp. SN-593]
MNDTVTKTSADRAAPDVDAAKRQKPARAPRMTWSDRLRNLQSPLYNLLGIVILLAAWQICSATHLVDPTFASSPWKILVAGKHLYSQGDIYTALGQTGKEFGIGELISIVAGTIIGLVIGASRVLYDMTRGLIDILYSVPHVLFLPVIIFWFGIGSTSRVIIVIWSGILPLVINTVAGSRALNADYRRVSTAFCTPKLKRFYKVALPASLPFILSGIRLSVGRGLIGIIVAEFFMGSGGIGFMVQFHMSQLDTSGAMAVIVTLCVAALLLNSFVAWCEKRFANWSIND